MTIQYQGGYFLHNEALVRGFGNNAHTALDLSKLSRYTVDAVNHIQDTPWQVNGFILNIIKDLYALGEDVTITDSSGKAEYILRVEEPIDPRIDPKEPAWVLLPPDVRAAMTMLPADVWETLDKNEKKKHRAKRARTLTMYEEALGSYRGQRRVLVMAEEMWEHDKFYFPHNMDFRLRIYPIPTDLTPQGSDMAKGCLRFRQPTRLGARGLYWMGFMVATHWGEDKLHPDERAEYAKDEEFNAQMAEWVDDPINNRGWLKADKPFQFLAVAHEWVWAHRSGDPEAYLSHLPGDLDGSCNGAQHLSLLIRDMVGAEATNCRKLPSRKDLYLEVADRVYKWIMDDCEKGNLLAQEWRPKMQDKSGRRKVVKRAVMTVPYGVTERGVADFMINDKHVSTEAESMWQSAIYMRDLIWKSIGETIAKGRELQHYFQACALVCAKAGKPMCWDTPAGSKVTQAYRNLVAKRIKSMNTKFYVYEEPDADEDNDQFLERIGMKESKMVTSAPPNVIHSCDAAHLQITVCRMHDAGIRNFSMIHDSFGCPFAQMDIMRDILRETIVDMYSGNYLAEFKESVEKYSGLTMPELPELGDFDISEVLESDYFFS